MKKLSRKQVMARMKVAVPGLWMKFSEEFDGTPGGIWTSAESTALHRSTQLEPFDYHTEAYSLYEDGILKSLRDLLEQWGWYCEWYDPGTVMIWRID